MLTWLAVAVVAFVVYIVGLGLFERFAPPRWRRAYQRNANKFFRLLSGRSFGWAIVETTGRKSGLPRATPIGGRLSGSTYWLVAGEGRSSDFVKNIEANRRVRVQVHGKWRSGTATILDFDNARRRLLRLNPVNSAFVAIAARNPLTIRIDLED